MAEGPAVQRAALRREFVRWDGFLALGFGAGLSPRAPGTVGTVAALPLVLLLRPLDPAFYALAVAVLFLLGVWICDRVGRRLGSPDHGALVWDEIVGFLVAAALVPVTAAWLLAAFLCFRALDILKPWPVGWADRRFGGGFGVMLDDLLAGAGTLLLLEIARWALTVG
jgi:phosphatidylglycerophosphatase A